MAKQFKRICVLFITILVFKAAYAEETIVITTGELPPRYSEDLKYNGIMPRIITEAFALEGINTRYKFYPWKRALVTAQKGQADATALWGFKKERTIHFYYSEPVHKSQWVFFHLKSNNFDWKTFDDLKELKIGGVREFTYGEAFYNAEKQGKIKVNWVTDEQQTFKMLMAGRLDITPGQPEITYFYLSKSFRPEKIDLFSHHPKPFHSFKLHLLFSKKVKRSKRLLKSFNRGVKHLEESGKLHQFLIEDVKRGVYLK